MLYGGGLWRTWYDRDLMVAGKVIIKPKDSDKLESRYWASKRPLVKLPNLAIHLAREEQPISKETETKPLIAMSVVENLFKGGIEPIADDKFRIDEKHFATFTDLMANDIGVSRDQIVDFELNLCDSHPAQLVGMHEEFVSSPRLDNLASSLCALDSLIKHSKLDVKTKRNHSEVDMIMLFDHEEVGSASAQGCDSNMANEVTTRVSEALGGKT